MNPKWSPLLFGGHHFGLSHPQSRDGLHDSLTVKLRASAYANLQEAQDSLCEASGKLFSHSILVRAALTWYLKSIKQMPTDELKREAYFLQENFR
jgi:hypothetical protein